MMPVSSNQGAGCDIVTVIGVDRSIALTVTENAVARPWASDAFTALIYERDGATAAAVTTWTFTTGASGAATLALTAAQLTTLGVGTFRYALINVTQDQPWFEGQLSVVGPTSSGTATTGITLALTTGGGITLDISVVATTAAQVTLLDAGGYYASTDLEALSQEQPTLFLPLGVPGTGQYFKTTANQTTAVATLNRLCYTPVEIGKPITVDRIGISCTGLVNPSTVRLGIYASAANGYPGALILDAGTVDTSTTGIKEININQAITARRFWFAAVAQTGTPTTRVSTAGKLLSFGFMSTFTGGVGPATNATLIAVNPNSIYEDSVSGTLPLTATPGYDASFVNAISVFARQI
jgi:hypothetical protein